MWIVVGIILVLWIIMIETGGSDFDDTQRNPDPQTPGSSSTERTSVDNPPVKEIPSDPGPDPDPEPGDDRDIGIDRERYSDRLERPEFDFDDVESRTSSGRSDEPPSLNEVPDFDELPDPDDVFKDQ